MNVSRTKIVAVDMSTLAEVLGYRPGSELLGIMVDKDGENVEFHGIEPVAEDECIHLRVYDVNEFEEAYYPWTCSDCGHTDVDSFMEVQPLDPDELIEGAFDDDEWEDEDDDSIST